MATAISSNVTAPAPRSRQLLLVVAAAVVAALLLVIVGFRAQSFVANTPDPYGYVAMGRSLVEGHGFAPYGSVLNRRGPLYPALIAVLYLVFGEHPLAIQLTQVLMHGCVAALAFDTGRRLYNRRTALLAGLLCALHPALLRYVADFHVETFLTLLSTVAVWRSVILLEKPNAKNGALFGVASALAALAKPVFLAHPVVFGAWWLLRDRHSLARAQGRDARAGDVRGPLLSRSRAAIAAGAIFVAMGVVILPWTYRNYRSSGHIVLVTTGFGDAFLRGYIFSKPDYALLRLPPYTFAENESNALFMDLCAREGTVWARNDVESEKILSRAAKEKLFASPLGFLRKFVVQLFTFWYQMTSFLNSVLTGLAAIVFWVFALIGWRRARAEGRLSWPLLLPILSLNVALAILLALGRYSVPVLPALIILAAFGIDTLLPPRLRFE